MALSFGVTVLPDPPSSRFLELIRHRRGERLRVRLDLRLARPLAGVVPAAHARRAGDHDDEARPLRDEPRHARADGARERLRDAARHLGRPDGDGNRTRRLGRALHRADKPVRVAEFERRCQMIKEFMNGREVDVEREGAQARVGATGASRDPDVGRRLRAEGARRRGSRRRRRHHPARRPGDHPVDHGHRARGGRGGRSRSRRRSSASSARRATSPTTSPTRASRCAGSRRWSRTTSWISSSATASSPRSRTSSPSTCACASSTTTTSTPASARSTASS